MQQASQATRGRWLNCTVLGIGLASLFSDWAHEIATTVLPEFFPNPSQLNFGLASSLWSVKRI